MPERPLDYTHPNVGPWRQHTRTSHVLLTPGSFIHRRGGKFIQRGDGTLYKLGDANSSNLAGYAETEQIPEPHSALTVSGSGRRIPINTAREASHVIPTTGRVATEADFGRDYALVTNGAAANQTLQQFINMNSTHFGVVRVQGLADSQGSHVHAMIPPTVWLGDI